MPIQNKNLAETEVRKPIGILEILKLIILPNGKKKLCEKLNFYLICSASTQSGCL